MVSREKRKAQISIDMIASLFIYMLALTLVLTTVFRTYGFFSNSNLAEKAGLISDRLSLMLVQSEGSAGWENDPFSATSVGFASGDALSYGKIRAFAGLGTSEVRTLLGITYSHRMKVSYMPAIVMDVTYENPKMVLQGTAPLNAFSPGDVNLTITTYDGNGMPLSADSVWAILNSPAYGNVSRADSTDGSVSAIMVAPADYGNAAYAQRMAGGRYRVSYNATGGGTYTVRFVALSGNMFGDREVTINVA